MLESFQAVTDQPDPVVAAWTLTGDDLIPDRALEDPSEDALDHKAVADTLFDLVCSVRTPANIALFGPWGSGKSSIYSMLQAQIAARSKSHPSRVILIRYDISKFDGQSLQRNFLSHVANELGFKSRKIENIEGTAEVSRLRIGRYLRENWLSIVAAIILAFAVAAVWALFGSWASAQLGIGNTGEPASLQSELIQAVPSASVVFGAIVVALLLSTQGLAATVERHTRAPLKDADEFYRAFDRLIKDLTKSHWFRRDVERLVVFVDELDRCSPASVARALSDLVAFLDHRACVFVVAADREVIEEAIAKAPQARPFRSGEPYYATAAEYLDKVFQHQLAVPPTRPEALTSYAMRMADQAHGIWDELRKNRHTYEDVVYSLVPAHVRSPRRVKVLLNNFATNMRIAGARAMDMRSRAVEMAVLTVLQTEFASVARDLVREPLLLQALLDPDLEKSPRLNALVEAYEGIDDEEAPASPSPRADSRQVVAASPLADLPEARETEDRVATRRQLNVQLHSYLGKIHAAGIPLPTLDLVYLQPAGHASGLADASLAQVLDLAADTAPSELARAFSDAETCDKIGAIGYLVAQVPSSWGEARANLIESICRVAMSLSVDEARKVARVAAATVLSEAAQGRWRSSATRGAILLGLLDEEIHDPLKGLEAIGFTEGLAADGTLAALMPALPSVGLRAAYLYPSIVEAYSLHPEYLLEALKTLPADQVAALWELAGPSILAIISKAPEAATARRPVDSSEGAADQYRALLGALIERKDVAVEDVSFAVASLALDADAPLLRAILVEHRDALSDQVLSPAKYDQLALGATSSVSDDAEAMGWAKTLNLTPKLDHVLAKRAFSRLLEISTVAPLEKPSSEAAAHLKRLMGAMSDVRTEDALQAVLEALSTHPPVGTPSSRALRRSLISLIDSALELRPALGQRSAYCVQSLIGCVEDGSIPDEGAEQACAEIRDLTPVHARHLETKLRAATGSALSPVLLVRLRTAARKRAGLTPLPGRLVASLAQELGGPQLVAEWALCGPSHQEMLTVHATHRLSSPVVGSWSPLKSVAERSKMWIQMEASGEPAAMLSAAGLPGVDASVVDHMKSQILGVSLTAQTTSTDRLLTANLANDKTARSAAGRLALALLKDGLVGSGANAAKTAIRANGGSPETRHELREAFDKYTKTVAKNPIPQYQLRELSKLGLLIESPSSPLAKIFGWRHD